MNLVLYLSGNNKALAQRINDAFPTIDGKLLVGYQGWHKAPADGGSEAGWGHWFDRKNKSLRVHVAMWPDMDEYEKSYDTGLLLNNGQPATVYSAYDYSTVNTHLRWMAEYGIDGPLVQRFVPPLRFPEKKEHSDQVLEHIQRAVGVHGLVFAVEYDVSGVQGGGAATLNQLLEDWEDLVLNKKITQNPAYLHQDGKPVLGIWGLGFTSRNFTWEESLDLIHKLKNHPNPAVRPYILGGTPAHWRTRRNDARQNPQWSQVYDAMDMLSPWPVGRFENDAGADRFRTDIWEKDIGHRNAIGKTYMPTIYPGSSFYNASPEVSPFNRIPRNCGKFLWRQAWNAAEAMAGSKGPKVIKIAMFDEVDESTAIYKCAPSQETVPDTSFEPPGYDMKGIRFLTLDQDGCDLPSDWYLQLAGQVGRMLRGEIPLSSEMPLTPPVGAKGSITRR